MVNRSRGMKSIYRKMFERAKPFLRTRKNLIHTKIALRYAVRLLKEVKGDEEVVIPAVLLHDVGWSAVPEHLQLNAFGPNRSNPQAARVHEVEGAKTAKKILEKLRYPSEKVNEICQIIRGHDSRKRPISRSDRIVKDADKLFRYSRRGVAIDLERFHAPRGDYLHYLENCVEKWFFLSVSRQLASQELARRRTESQPENQDGQKRR
ncbi:MAG TPA: HD domain-containing protein [Thermodesulfobacteriota bacterium]|nr:HD domain-containing protein [Thermodesulfobacteriota bacterium]